MSRLDIYRRADNRWAWRLVAGNGQIVANDGGQEYENRADCERIAHDVISGKYAPLVERHDAELAAGYIEIKCPDCEQTIIGHPGDSIEHADGGAHVWVATYGGGV